MKSDHNKAPKSFGVDICSDCGCIGHRKCGAVRWRKVRKGFVEIIPDVEKDKDDKKN